ncbi:hypothetical protein HQ544_02010 [Candidatus Falkowbacteria bacterium]|nr:hypothetical protein [Candidatus Falkowbacteria bacterium]
MSRVKPYKYEEYSLLDIKKHLEERGYKLKLCKEGSEDEYYKEYKVKNNLTDYYVRKHPVDWFNVVGTTVYIDIPKKDRHNDIIFAQINFEDYPKMKNYEESKKVYGLLKRKFGRSKDERWSHIKEIKDSEDIKKLLKDNKRGWWPV